MNDCEHKRTIIWEPHLAGARKCRDCGQVYNPNCKPQWFFERPSESVRLSLALKREEKLMQGFSNLARLMEFCLKRQPMFSAEEIINAVASEVAIAMIDAEKFKEPDHV